MKCRSITRLCVILSAIYICLAVIELPALANDSFDKFQARNYTNPLYDHSLPYRLFVPADYNPHIEYPLVIFLHGSGERGSDNSLQLTAYDGATIWAEESNQSQYPCFILAPQCPAYEAWVDLSYWPTLSYDIDSTPISDELQMTLEIIFELEKEFNIDTNGLYLTGLSMGGMGAWYLFERYPNLFAAAIPVCGIGDITKAVDIAGKPVWAFHGEYDDTVPVYCTRAMIEEIKAAGGDPKYTEYPGGKHNIWTLAYHDPELIPWTFSQKLAVKKSKKSYPVKGNFVL